MNFKATQPNERSCVICQKLFQPKKSNQICCGDKECKKTLHLQHNRKYMAKDRQKYNERLKKWHDEHLEQAREIKRKWNNDPKNAEKRAYDPSKRKSYTAEQRMEIKSREQAREALKQYGIRKMCFFKNPETDVHKRRIEVHHMDGNIFNNKIDNLRYMCVDCHKFVHRQKRLGINPFLINYFKVSKEFITHNVTSPV